MTSATPRPEYPRPQFVRDSWINLNGEWNFAFDFGKSGEQAGWHSDPSFDQKITVPFCPESVLSGIGHTDFIPACWYARSFTVPSEWAGKPTVIHFGASGQALCDTGPQGRHKVESSQYQQLVSIRFVQVTKHCFHHCPSQIQTLSAPVGIGKHCAEEISRT